MNERTREGMIERMPRTFLCLQNSMEDSLATFEEVVQNLFLDKTNFVLFLNKRDLLEERLKQIPLSTCFPKYTGE